ncbi:glycosyltransferase family 2 protein [Desulfitobacterium sp. THU1]|uniref:glycosyltransferase family 2 protein n=1 Tax=Desulfitobacterium sp. THU1 TaxID=3138072 RepID=UPI00311E8001
MLEVSIIIPTYNEERFIKTCLDSIYGQSFPVNKMEILVIDGKSSDQTIQVVKQEIEAGRSNLRLLENPQRIQASALNLGIRASTGKYIVRMDAHTTYDCDYVKKCVEIARDTGADNVGGIAIATGKTRIGKVISLALSCSFGVGNAVFRLGGIDGEVKTVPFGTFPRETFEKFGLFNESLARCEDKEFNYRIRKGGGRIFMSKDLKAFYNNRETIRGLAKQCHDNGLWNMFTLVLSPGSLSIRHFVPFVFVSSLIGIGTAVLVGLLTASWLQTLAWVLVIELWLYFILNIIFSMRLAQQETYHQLPLLMLIFFVMHTSYGLGSIVGAFKTPWFRNKVHKATQARVSV